MIEGYQVNTKRKKARVSKRKSLFLQLRVNNINSTGDRYLISAVLVDIRLENNFNVSEESEQRKEEDLSSRS